MWMNKIFKFLGTSSFNSNLPVAEAATLKGCSMSITFSTLIAHYLQITVLTLLYFKNLQLPLGFGLPY